MTRREIMERRRKRRRIQMIRRSIKAGIYALLVVVVVVVLWNILAPIIKKGQKDKSVEAKADVIGEGDAVRTTYTGTGGTAGWNVDENGWWYLNEDNTFFANGWQTIEAQKYYFNDQGYMTTGWKDIDGASHFFTVDGREDPDAKQKLVAITYDDGPSEHTDRLLDCLEANGAKATFFVVGKQVETYPDVIKREDALGMEIGSHTYDHTYLTKVDADTVVQKMQQNEDVLKNLIGRGTTIMRPTGGGVSDTMRSVMDKPMIQWDVDTRDWETKDAQQTVDNILNQVKDGSVILMHDLYSATVDASEIIIPELIRQGYKLVTISELAEKRGVTLEPAKEYFDFYPPEGTTGTDEAGGAEAPQDTGEDAGSDEAPQDTGENAGGAETPQDTGDTGEVDNTGTGDET